MCADWREGISSCSVYIDSISCDNTARGVGDMGIGDTNRGRGWVDRHDNIDG